MLVINRLTKAGEIKQVVLKETEVVVILIDKQTIVYRRADGNSNSTNAAKA